MAQRVAVIEDDPAIGSMLKTILALEGYEVATFGDGKSAVPSLRSGRFDAVILDIMLPGQDGIAVLRDIRGAHETERIPVVMLTAKTDDVTTWAGWQAGCDWFLTKPFDPDDIVRVLRRIAEPGYGAGEAPG
ncbi:MAG: response regulator transcription factor [Actinomycetota bacterium]